MKVSILCLLLALLAFVSVAFCAVEGKEGAKAVAEVYAILENNTPTTMQLIQSDSSHGVFTLSPPQIIPPHTSGNWSVTSSGVAWAKGFVQYTLSGVTGFSSFSWDVPPLGSNSYSASAPPGSPYSAQYSGGKGYHAKILYTITGPNYLED